LSTRQLRNPWTGWSRPDKLIRPDTGDVNCVPPPTFSGRMLLHLTASQTQYPCLHWFYQGLRFSSCPLSRRTKHLGSTGKPNKPLGGVNVQLRCDTRLTHLEASLDFHLIFVSTLYAALSFHLDLSRSSRS